MQQNTDTYPAPHLVDWCCIAAVNQPLTLAANLAASPPLVDFPGRLNIQTDQPSAAVAYNKALAATSAPIVVLAHQDVYLPRGWELELHKALDQLDRYDPNWAVAGVMGVGRDDQHCGRVWSTGLGRELGTAFDIPIPTISLDEVLLILKRSSGLQFDDDLPDFHLYGTDIVQSALKAGFGAYIVHAPVIHNSRPIRNLPAGFGKAYHYMQQKWAAALPITTLVTRITKDGAELRHSSARLSRNRWRRRLRRTNYLLRFAPEGLIGPLSARRIALRLGYERN